MDNYERLTVYTSIYCSSKGDADATLKKWKEEDTKGDNWLNRYWTEELENEDYYAKRELICTLKQAGRGKSLQEPKDTAD